MNNNNTTKNAARSPEAEINDAVNVMVEALNTHGDGPEFRAAAKRVNDLSAKYPTKTAPLSPESEAAVGAMVEALNTHGDGPEFRAALKRLNDLLANERSAK